MFDSDFAPRPDRMSLASCSQFEFHRAAEGVMDFRHELLEGIRALTGIPDGTDEAGLASALAHAYESGQRRYPAFHVPPRRYGEHIGQCIKGSVSEESIAALRAEHLYLACGCGMGDSAAVAEFEREFFGEVQAVLARARIEVPLDEAEQRVRHRLFVGSAENPAKILGYGGRGDLRNWFRMCALRLLLNAATRKGRDVPVRDDWLDEWIGNTTHLETAYLKVTYGAAFRDAMREATLAIKPRERNLLRFSLADGMGIDQIAAIHGVHRATAARWLIRAKTALAESVRAVLQRQLGASQGEVESILRLIRSQVDVSIDRLLRSTSESQSLPNARHSPIEPESSRNDKEPSS